jgi:hypothetical protein
MDDAKQQIRDRLGELRMISRQMVKNSLTIRDLEREEAQPLILTTLRDENDALLNKHSYLLEEVKMLIKGCRSYQVFSYKCFQSIGWR